LKRLLPHAAMGKLRFVDRSSDSAVSGLVLLWQNSMSRQYRIPGSENWSELTAFCYGVNPNKSASVQLDSAGSAVYTTNMATPAANIAAVAIATTVHPRRELGWPCINLLSEATIRIATRRKGANSPLMTAVQ